MKTIRATKEAMRRFRKKLSISVALAILTSVLSGCINFDASLDAMLSPPKLTETQTAIYNALILNTGDQIELVYPRVGDHRSPFVLYDIDDEKTDEALVFYREKVNQEGNLRINLLDQRDGEWVSVYDRPLTGVDVERVDFYNFSETEGNTDIVVSCSVLSQSEKSLCVLEYSNNELLPLYNGSYSFMEPVNLNGDRLSELFFVSYDSILDYCSAFILGKTEGEDASFGIISSQPLYSDVASIQRMSKQRVSENDYFIFLDYGKGDNSYGTQVLRCVNNKLTLIPLETITRRNNSNVPMLYSTDIEGDGIIEIPVTVPAAGYESLTIPEQMFFVEWYTIDEENNFLISLNKKYVTYMSVGGEYVFYMPVRWQGFVTVEKTGNTVNFSMFDPAALENPVLLSICVSSMIPAVNDGWEVYGEKGSGVYVKGVNGNDPMALTEDELAGCLLVSSGSQGNGE